MLENVAQIEWEVTPTLFNYQPSTVNHHPFHPILHILPNQLFHPGNNPIIPPLRMKGEHGALRKLTSLNRADNLNHWMKPRKTKSRRPETEAPLPRLRLPVSGLRYPFSLPAFGLLTADCLSIGLSRTLTASPSHLLPVSVKYNTFEKSTSK